MSERWNPRPVLGLVAFVLLSSTCLRCFAGEAAAPPAALDRAAIIKELTDFTAEGMNRRFGPDYTSLNPKPQQPFPEVWMASAKDGAKGRRYQLGGPWARRTGDYSSTQGQVLYVPDKGLGVDRVTILEMSNNTYTESPEPPWWGGFRPEPCSADWANAMGGPPGAPVCMARGMGPWSNCGLIVFSSGWVATAGTCTAKGSNPTFRFPPHKVPTAISITPRNEFALVTVCNLAENKGEVAVFALEGCGKGTFVHDWKDPHPCLLNVARFTRIKLLGYIDLPEVAFPTGICAVGDTLQVRLNGPDGHQGVLSQFDLSRQTTRDRFHTGDNNGYANRSGFAVVISKYEQKAAFIDLQPLFSRVREMYFTTEQKYQETRNAGPDPKQWPYSFDVDPSWKPPVVKVVDHPTPTAVIASLAGGEKARAFIASLDGNIGIYRVGGLATEAPASPEEIIRDGEVMVGRNPVCLTYQKHTRNSDTIIAASRGDREIAWIRCSDDGARVFRILRDERLMDPVHVEMADTHGTDTQIITVADFKGRKIINYRFADVVFTTNGGARFGMGPDGKAEFECGGILEFPGSPFCVSATNVN